MLTQFSEILARQAQGWSVPGCVRQRGWTPSLPRISSQTDHRTSPVVPFRALLMASAEVLRGFTGQKLPAISSGIGSPCESFNKKKQFSGSDEFTRTTSIETCRCCEWLKIAEESLKDLQNSNWVWSEIECLLILHSSYSSFSLQDLPGFLQLSQFQSSWFGTFPFSIDWILADSHPATSCCALQEAKRFLGLPTMIVSQVLHKKTWCQCP